jgi:hypothetical protein
MQLACTGNDDAAFLFTAAANDGSSGMPVWISTAHLVKNQGSHFSNITVSVESAVLKQRIMLCLVKYLHVHITQQDRDTQCSDATT